MQLKQILFALVLALGTSTLDSLAAGAELQPFEPLVRVVDLDVGQSAKVTLCDGEQISVELVSLKEHRDPIRLAVRGADLVLKINGQTVDLKAAPYRLPMKVAGVQVDCSVTGGMNSNGSPAFWGLDRDARLRFWPAESRFVKLGSFIYPVKQKWFATRTWFDNEAIDHGKTILKSIYYHAGLDIGAAEGLTEVIAATDALVVQRGMNVLEGHRDDTPTSPRDDVVYLLDARGWYYRYSHLKEIDPTIQPGRIISQGHRIGLAGKEGASGGWSHLHFEIKSRQPSGKWGTQAAFAFVHQANVEDGMGLYANSRHAHLIVAGEETVLDGSKSWSANDDIQSYEWELSSGKKATGPTVRVKYDRPGVWTEILRVSNSTGESSVDFAVVMVLDPQDLSHYSANLNANYYPTKGLQPNDEITFQVRAFNMQGGEERWDFGDGSPPQITRSPADAANLAPEGYAKIKHRYQQPGQYIVNITRTHDNGRQAVTKLWVTVKADVEADTDQ